MKDLSSVSIYVHDYEEKISQKIQEIKNNLELWKILQNGSCCSYGCSVPWDSGLAKLPLHEIMWYLVRICNRTTHDEDEELFVEKLTRYSQNQLWELLVLYMNKRDLLDT